MAVHAQRKVWRIGFLSGRMKPEALGRDAHGAFLDGMRQLGYTENQDFIVDWRFAEGDFARLPALATELVQSNVDIIVTSPAIATRAARQATSSIPIIFAYVSDPVASGLVVSLAKPGGNVTGLAVQQTDVTPKQLQLLKQMLPNLLRVAVLSNPANTGSAVLVKRVHAEIEQASMTPEALTAGSPSEIEQVFAGLSPRKIDAVMVLPDPFFASQRHQLARIAIEHRLPTIFGDPDYVEAGGLISYGDRLASFIRQTTYYVDQIIKGAKPADLPVQQPTRFELAVNLKTARELGLKVPEMVLVIADQVIE